MLTPVVAACEHCHTAVAVHDGLGRNVVAVVGVLPPIISAVVVVVVVWQQVSSVARAVTLVESERCVTLARMTASSDAGGRDAGNLLVNLVAIGIEGHDVEPFGLAFRDDNAQRGGHEWHGGEDVGELHADGVEGVLTLELWERI